jgi:hypothetical protein
MKGQVAQGNGLSAVPEAGNPLRAILDTQAATCMASWCERCLSRPGNTGPARQP